MPNPVDRPTEAKRRAMQAQRERDTKPELQLRGQLHQRGYRYRLHVRPLVGLRRTVDLAFPRERVAVEVLGCFWHACPEHGTLPKANQDWWRQKLNANRARDADTSARLADAGWSLVVVWEHEAPADAADRVAAEVERRRLDSASEPSEEES